MKAIACSAPQPPALPKRIARVRRAMESKRLDSFKAFHESLKKTAKDEQEFVSAFFKKTEDMWNDIKAEDEEEAEKADD
jgi:predicted metalloprotease